ncbi:hypothetical protein AAMO2058_001479100 [Amorphochlora amoebiformis]
MPHDFPKKQNPCIVIGTAAFFAIIAIVSMALSIDSYRRWKANADDFREIVRNWEVQPILNMTVASTCPTGWEPVPGASFTVERHDCGCTNDTVYGTTTFTEIWCDELSPAATSCTDEFNFYQTATMSKWRGTSQLCLLRGGISAIDRPVDGCDSGQRVCNTNSETGDLCFPSELPCPIVNISRAPDSRGSDWESVTLSDGEVLYFTRTYPDARPFLQWDMGENDVCKNAGNRNTRSDRNWDGSSGVGAMVGRNYTLDAPRGTTGREYYQALHEGRTCTTDDRYRQVDVQDEFSLLNFNGLNTSGSFPYAFDSASATWKLYNRPEILWDKDCANTRGDVQNAESRVDSLTKGALALMIISIFATIFDLITTFFVTRTLLDDDPDNDKSAEAWQKLGKTVCICGNMITTVTIVSIAAVSQGFFRSIKSCSDGTTNQTLGFLSDEVDTIARFWYAKIALDALLFLYAVYYAFSYRQDMAQYGLCCCKWKTST